MASERGGDRRGEGGGGGDNREEKLDRLMRKQAGQD